MILIDLFVILFINLNFINRNHNLSQIPKIDAWRRSSDTFIFFYFSLSKPGVYITHNATSLPTLLSEILVLC